MIYNKCKTFFTQIEKQGSINETKELTLGEQNINILPNYPKVIAFGCSIRIFWESSKDEYWGDEENMDEAKKVAYEMDLELKTTAYVKKILIETLSHTYDILIDENIPHDIAKNALHSAHLAILQAIIQFDRSNENKTLIDFFENM